MYRIRYRHPFYCLQSKEGILWGLMKVWITIDSSICLREIEQEYKELIEIKEKA